ncbi:hypothetical protein ERJ75_001627500 [Trypanosoma vivax]|nr:hypothetical protein ERJ75_001627500 [Trypanosoma vivax]
MESASWNLVKSICAPRPLTSPLLVVDGHPLTKPQQAQALAQMYVARSTRAPFAPEMKMTSTRHSTFRLITEAELDVALRELSSGTAPGDDEIHYEQLKRRGRVSKRRILQLFNYSLCTGQAEQVKNCHHSSAAEAEQASEQYGVFSAGDAYEHAVQADWTH